jgi:hypothetical protein
MVVAHLFKLLAGIVVMVIASALMHLGDLFMRLVGRAPSGRIVGVET